MTAHPLLTLSLDRVSLFLDLDGTLAPFRDKPDAVGPDIARNALLRNMASRLNGRLAVVSGRSVADVDRILEGTVVSIAGSHGLQRRDARLDMLTAPVHPKLKQAIEEVRAFVRKHAGTLAEEKPLSVALHYRSNPGLEPVAIVFADDLARRTGLKLQHGSQVVEFLSPGMDKGRAIRAFMVEPPFSGSVPIFVGDDLTDEDGFRGVRSFGGVGILVGPYRETFARYHLADVAAVHAWLAEALKTQIFSLEAPVEPSYCRI